MRFLIIIGLFICSLTFVHAAPPNLGDNSIFRCAEVEDDLDPGQCFGVIEWVADANGNDKGGEALRFRRARKIIRRVIRFLKKQRRKANKQGDETLASEFDLKIQNARDTRSALRSCHFDFFEACSSSSNGDDMSGGGNDGTSFPSLSEACNLINDPAGYGQIERKRIVNGVFCSGTVAANSPVMQITLDDFQHCTGTYVAANTILTAAHCLENVSCDGLKVLNSAGSQIIGASECISHPSYNTGSEPQAFDVAIIKLPNDFDGITPAKVASTVETPVGADAAFAGYGRNEQDDTKLRATFNTISNVSTEVISTFFTRGDQNQGTTCNGDSGGPLFVFQDGEWKTTGTLSDGSAADCALPGTNPDSDLSNWANLSSSSNQQFIRDNTEGVLD